MSGYNSIKKYTKSGVQYNIRCEWVSPKGRKKCHGKPKQEMRKLFGKWLCEQHRKGKKTKLDRFHDFYDLRIR